MGKYIKKSIPVALRRSIAMKNGCANGESIDASCFYCGSKGVITWFKQPTDRGDGWVHFQGLELDHVDPEFLGGEASNENIVLACTKCNRSKGHKKLSEWVQQNGKD